MKRLLASLAALLALGAFLSSCNSSAVSAVPSVAARVNGVAITTSHLDSVLVALKNDTAYLCLAAASSQIRTTGVGSGTWNTVYADNVLTQLVKFRLVADMVAALHLSVPVSDRAVASTEIEDGFETLMSGLETRGVSCTGAPSAILSGLGTSFRNDLVTNELDTEAFSAYLAGTSLAPASLAAWERDHAGATTESCLSVIGVTSRQQALGIAAAVRRGASFASEAEPYTSATGAGPGGAVGCAVESQWNVHLGPTIAALKLRTVSVPISYGSGWLLLYVTSRTLEPLSYVIPQIDSEETPTFEADFGKELERASISVAPAYGSVQRSVARQGASFAIVPPRSTACAYALSPSAAGCPSGS